MFINPLLAVPDVTRIALASAIFYYIKRLEDIKCLVNPSWKPRFLKGFLVVVILLTVLSMFFTCNVDMNSSLVSIVMIFITLIILLYIWILYTYVRELEENFKNCELSNDIKYVHEFVKLYSLLLVLFICMAFITIFSTLLSFLKLPKYYMWDMKMKKGLSSSNNLHRNSRLQQYLNNNNSSSNSKSNSSSGKSSSSSGKSSSSSSSKSGKSSKSSKYKSSSRSSKSGKSKKN